MSKPRFNMPEKNSPDANVYSLIGRISALLSGDTKKEFGRRAFYAESYEKFLELVKEYVDIGYDGSADAESEEFE